MSVHVIQDNVRPEGLRHGSGGKSPALTSWTGIRTQSSQSEICGGTLTLVTGFLPSTPVSPFQHYSKNIPHSSSPRCRSYKKGKRAKPGRLSESDQCPFSSGEALNRHYTQILPPLRSQNTVVTSKDVFILRNIGSWFSRTETKKNLRSGLCTTVYRMCKKTVHKG